jgi:hypothetical protein
MDLSSLWVDPWDGRSSPAAHLVNLNAGRIPNESIGLPETVRTKKVSSVPE